MKRFSYFLYLLTFFCPSVFAAPGEEWEITTSVSMEGMSMPRNTSLSCMRIDEDVQPIGVDDECKTTDLKRITNGIAWKMSCKDGFSGSGKQTRVKDTITGEMTLSSDGEVMQINMIAKRTGKKCDTEAQAKQMQAKFEQRCRDDVAKLDGQRAMSQVSFYLAKNSSCSMVKNDFCAVIKRDYVSDLKTIDLLRSFQGSKENRDDSIKNLDIEKECGLNLASAQQTVCASNANNRQQIRLLEKVCPSEAKALQTKMRQEFCTGRVYTSKTGMADCMAGSNKDRVNEKSSEAETSSGTEEGSTKNELLRGGAKAIKGLKDMFGF